MYRPLSLEGRTILVTGASSGIGRTCAVEAGTLGATIMLVARDTHRTDETSAMVVGSSSERFVCDLARTDRREEAIRRCRQHRRDIAGLGPCWLSGRSPARRDQGADGQLRQGPRQATPLLRSGRRCRPGRRIPSWRHGAIHHGNAVSDRWWILGPMRPDGPRSHSGGGITT
jgi:hypothetical protein